MRFNSASRVKVSTDERTRSRERVFAFPEIRMVRRALQALVLSLVLLPWPVSVAFAQPDDEQIDSAERAVAWLLAQRADDGGFLGFSGESDPSTTADAVIALAAANRAGIEVDLAATLAYLEAEALAFAQLSPGAAAKFSLALAAAGENSRDFNSVNPLSIVETQANEGRIGDGLYDHALGILALAGSGAEVPAAAIDILRPAQNDDGLWAFDGAIGEGVGDSNTTSLVVQALVAAGAADDEMVTRALDSLASIQGDDGGFPYLPGDPSDANSTALAVQALIAGGFDPTGDIVRRGQAALAGFQNESGAFHFMDGAADDNIFATVQAIPAILGESLLVQDWAPLATPEAA